LVFGDTERVIEASEAAAGGAAGRPSPGRRLDVAWCSGCGQAHGMGHCPRAVQLTEEAIRRSGARFNWR